MVAVHLTNEYEKCRQCLLTRGKIGKDAYDKARVAEAEARQGTIRTVSRTRHGENRIPDAEKYDLPGDYRLILQRMNGSDSGRMFLFIGSHEEAEQWLENHRGKRWPPPPGQKQAPSAVSKLTEEKQRLTQELKNRELEQQKLADHVQGLASENGALERELQGRNTELHRLAAQVKELEGKQGEIEAERQQLIRQREALAAQQQHAASEKAGLQGELERRAADQLAAQVKELEGKQGEVEAERQQLIRQREALAAQQQHAASEKAGLQSELERRGHQLRRLAARVAQLEGENQQLRQALQPSDAQPDQNGTRTKIRWPWIWGSFGAVAALLLVIGFSARGCSGSGGGVGPPKETKPEQTRTDTAIEKPPSGPPATKPQMKYLEGLIRRKGWSEKERDTEIVRALGYTRSYSKLTKQEASKLIDAWKERK